MSSILPGRTNTVPIAWVLFRFLSRFQCIEKNYQVACLCIPDTNVPHHMGVETWLIKIANAKESLWYVYFLDEQSYCYCDEDMEAEGIVERSSKGEGKVRTQDSGKGKPKEYILVTNKVLPGRCEANVVNCTLAPCFRCSGSLDRRAFVGHHFVCCDTKDDSNNWSYDCQPQDVILAPFRLQNKCNRRRIGNKIDGNACIWQCDCFVSENIINKLYAHGESVAKVNVQSPNHKIWLVRGEVHSKICADVEATFCTMVPIKVAIKAGSMPRGASRLSPTHTTTR